MDDTAASPCIKLCVLDPARGHCIGCGRTGEDIAGWLAMSEAERIAVNRQARARLLATAPKLRRVKLPPLQS